MKWIHHPLYSHLVLHILPISKFKKNLISFVLPTPIEEKPTYKSLLAKVLMGGTQRFPHIREIQSFLDDHYGASCSLKVSKAGEIQIFSATLVYPNEKFIPHHPKLADDLVSLLTEILFHPALEKNLLVPAYVEREKNQLKTSIESLYNDKSSYAYYQLLQKMCPHEPYRFYSQGSLEELKEIGPDNLTEFFNSFYSSWKGHLFIIGDLDPEEWIKKGEKYFPTYSTPPKPLPKPIFPNRPQNPLTHLEELEDLHQSHLYLGFRSSIHYGEGDFYALLAANGLYGTFPHSKLFLKVREESGLAYSTHSFVEKYKGLVFAYAGISPENREKLVQLMLDMLKEIQEGKISDFEWESTIQGMIYSFQSLQDSPTRLVDFGLSQVLAQRQESLEEIIEELRSLTKERMARAAQTIHLDIIYCLAPKEK